MLPWVLVTLVVLAVAGWGVVEWTGWGWPQGEERWKDEVSPPSGDRTTEAIPPPPAPALAYQQYHAVCQSGPPEDREQIGLYAAACLDHALETLRAAAGTLGGDPADDPAGEEAGDEAGEAGVETSSLDAAEAAVLRVQRAAEAGGAAFAVEPLAVDAAQAMVTLAREVAASVETVDPSAVEDAAAAAAVLDPTVALPEQAVELGRFFSSLGAALQPLAQPSPPPAPVPP